MNASSPLSSAFAAVPLLAIIRHAESQRTPEVLQRIARGGLRAAEITTGTPGWEAIIRSSPSELVVGAGTVTTVEHVTRAAEAGARFVVSPGFDREVVESALAHGLDVLPGVATGTEIGAALAAGAQFLKLFPAGPLGPAYLRVLRGPYPEERFVPTGGVGEADIEDWFAAGASAVAVGSELAGRTSPADDAGLDAIEDTARRLVALVASRR